MRKDFRKLSQRGSVSVQSAVVGGILATSVMAGGAGLVAAQSTPVINSGNSGLCVVAGRTDDQNLSSYKGDCIVETPTPTPTVSLTPTPTATASQSAPPAPNPTPSVTSTPTPTPTPTVATIGTSAGISSVVNTNSDVGSPFAIAVSSDGTKIVAIQSKKIFTSKDAGNTWKMAIDITNSMAGSSMSFKAVTPSKTGTSFYVAPTKVSSTASFSAFYKIDATVPNGVNPVSLPYGNYPSFTSMDSSDDGRNFLATQFDGFAYKGSSVTSFTQSIYMGDAKLTMSSDGTKAVAVSSSGSVYSTTNSGSTWTNLKQIAVRKWTNIDSDASGSKWIATEQNGGVYYSTDMGATWNQYSILGTGPWTSVSLSDDGQIIAASKAGTTGQVYFSKDGGNTWATSSSLGTGVWTLVKISPDGKRFYAATNVGLKTGVID